MLVIPIHPTGPVLNDVVRHRRQSRCDEWLVTGEEGGRNGARNPVFGGWSDTPAARAAGTTPHSGSG